MWSKLQIQDLAKKHEQKYEVNEKSTSIIPLRCLSQVLKCQQENIDNFVSMWENKSHII